ncbi:putative helix-turn-helix-domain-containing protein [Rosellinia necatrix]|uniref:Putative helix-turn-helix-domain-containing protein n=1 Tax=Rosellinia necatrix TaxID=77044 RepID=A0A1W2TQX3_ROSNE|nr:putative helix-turn-helix-domain-containing protein [Rosellinia necatrix]
MTSLYDLTIPTLINALKAEQNLLAQAEAFAAEKGIPIAELLEARLAPDMWPLSQQIVITALHSAMTVLKLTGTPPNKIEFGPASLEDSKKYLSETLELLSAVTPESVNGKEAQIVGAMMGPGTEVNMKAVDYVQGYLLPNVYFHVTTFYDILRSKGATLGKKDFLGTFLKLA